LLDQLKAIDTIFKISNFSINKLERRQSRKK